MQVKSAKRGRVDMNPVRITDELCFGRRPNRVFRSPRPELTPSSVKYSTHCPCRRPPRRPLFIFEFHFIFSSLLTVRVKWNNNKIRRFLSSESSKFIDFCAHVVHPICFYRTIGPIT